jgi:hypothetical protein
LRWRCGRRRGFLQVYISIAAVTASNGSALTAGHLEKPVGASLLAMEVNDDAGSLTPRGALRFFASKLAPTGPAAIGHPWPCAASRGGVHRNSTARRANARPRCLVVHAFPCGAAEGCDLLILIFSNLQIAKARSKDRPNAARTFGSPYRYFVICVPRNCVKNLIITLK